MKLNELIENVKQWSIERGLDKTDPLRQLVKLYEEIGELSSALNKNNTLEIMDGLGDTLVVLIILHQQLGLTLDVTLNYAYDQIKNRTGKTINGVFIKDE